MQLLLFFIKPCSLGDSFGERTSSISWFIIVFTFPYGLDVELVEEFEFFLLFLESKWFVEIDGVVEEFDLLISGIFGGEFVNFVVKSGEFILPKWFCGINFDDGLTVCWTGIGEDGSDGFVVNGDFGLYVGVVGINDDGDNKILVFVFICIPPPPLDKAGDVIKVSRFWSLSTTFCSSVFITKLCGEFEREDGADCCCCCFWFGVDEPDDNEIIDAVGLAGVSSNVDLLEIKFNKL